jgi:mannose-6-phosphate isomerase
MKPVCLEPIFVERVWGTTALTPWFPNRPDRIGEVWLTSDTNMTSEGIPLRALIERDGRNLLGSSVALAQGGRFPVLIKFLFTSDKLSVQVHPDDAYAMENELSPGKTEMWYVLRAGSDAAIAAGFRHTLKPEDVRRHIHEGTLEEELMWWPASAGDTYFIPAGTVHAIGGGFVICEIQQNSDVTYRLWDYGRDRPVHVESALAVATLGPFRGPESPAPFGGGELLASCPYFATERFSLSDNVEWHSDSERFHLLVVTRGTGEIIAGGVTQPMEQGQCWLIPALCGAYRLAGAELEILRVYIPG